MRGDQLDRREPARDVCVYCGALAYRDEGGKIITWVITPGTDDSHTHETIGGDS